MFWVFRGISKVDGDSSESLNERHVFGEGKGGGSMSYVKRTIWRL